MTRRWKGNSWVLVQFSILWHKCRLCFMYQWWCVVGFWVMVCVRRMFRCSEAYLCSAQPANGEYCPVIARRWACQVCHVAFRYSSACGAETRLISAVLLELRLASFQQRLCLISAFLMQIGTFGYWTMALWHGAISDGLMARGSKRWSYGTMQ